ncbi:MAG: LCCL domain-containing protein [Oscillospiraceae bacterium]|nr:LCCL domain-containing protein [Oscillospiraceae bacterium]
MKKLLTLTLAILMALTLVACGGSRSHTNGNNGGSVSDSTSESVSESNSTTYGTIPMPDGFPSNLGDAEFFSPETDDYLILHDPQAASWDGEKIYHLVSYDTSGEPVQWVMKSVWPRADVIPYQNKQSGEVGGEIGMEIGPEREGWGDRIAADGIVVGNAGFFDSMAMFVKYGSNISQALRSNYLPPTKDSADWTSERNSIDGAYVIIVSENSWVQGPAPEHFYFSKPSSNAASASGGNTAGGTDPTVYRGNVTHLRGQNDTTHEFYVIGTTSGQVWGNDIYTDDSTIAMAAVHAGVLKDGESGTVTIRILPGRDSYEGTTRNGVGTGSYAQWPGSYEFVK